MNIETLKNELLERYTNESVQKFLDNFEKSCKYKNEKNFKIFASNFTEFEEKQFVSKNDWESIYCSVLPQNGVGMRRMKENGIDLETIPYHKFAVEFYLSYIQKIEGIGIYQTINSLIKIHSNLENKNSLNLLRKIYQTKKGQKIRALLPRKKEYEERIAEAIEIAEGLFYEH